MMNTALLNPQIQEYITQNTHIDVHQLMLSAAVFEQVSNVELANQILAKAKCKDKLPTWYAQKGIIFPQALAIEQSSSELAAALKTTFVKGENIIDITGGFGVDAYYFAQKFQHVIHCEQQSDLSEIVAHNYQKMNVQNIDCVPGDGLEYIENQNIKYDIIYADPARRGKNNKVFLLEDCQPNILPQLDMLLQKCKTLMIKTSPLLDISLGFKAFKNVKALHISSIKNDCKELIWCIEKDFESENATLFCHAYHQQWREIEVPYVQESTLKNKTYASPQKYLYEPDVSIMKAGLFKSVCSLFGLEKIAQHTHLYTSAELKTDFIGKIFEVQELYSMQEFKKSVPKQAHIIAKNFPLKADEIAQKYKIKSGGNDFLLFFKDAQQELKIAKASKINF